MRLWLTLRNPPAGAAQAPAVCPRAGCGGRRFRLHQVVGKTVRIGHGTAEATTSGERAACPSRRRIRIHRYRCLSCGRTCRGYPAGIDRSTIPTAARRLAAALHFLGLSVRDVSRALAVLGTPLGKSQVHACVRAIVRGVRHRGMAPLLGRVGLRDGCDGGEGGVDRVARGVGASLYDFDTRDVDDDVARSAPAWIEVNGRRLPLRRAIDWEGRPALVIEGIDRDTRVALDRWARAVLSGFGVIAEVDYSEKCGRERTRAGGGAWVEGGEVVAAAVVDSGMDDAIGAAHGGEGRAERMNSPLDGPRPGVRLRGRLPSAGAAAGGGGMWRREGATTVARWRRAAAWGRGRGLGLPMFVEFAWRHLEVRPSRRENVGTTAPHP